MKKIIAYRGICKPNNNHKGNIGTLWIKDVDGLYKSKNKNFTLTEEQIQSDFDYGYLIRVMIEPE